MNFRRGLTLRSGLTLLASAGIVVVGLYYFFVDPFSSRLLQFRVNDFASAWSLPSDIARATYLLTPANGGGIYREGVLSYGEYERTGAFVVDLAYASERAVEILFVPSSRMYVVQVDGRQVYASKTQLLNLFVSDDGTRIAVSQRNTEVSFEAETAAWGVVVIDAESGKTWNVPGFAAVFYDVDTLLAFDASGIAALDYETGAREVVKDLPTALVYPSIAQSADGSKIAWTTLQGDLRVYDVIKSPNLQVLELKSGKTEEVRSRLALTNENAYEIALGEDGKTDIIRHAIFGNDSVRVRSLPSLLSATKLIP